MREIYQNTVTFLVQTLGLETSVVEGTVGTVLAILMYLLVRALMRRLLALRIKDITRQYVTRKTVDYLLGFVLLLAVLRIWFGSLTGWIAYVGIVSAGLAIALQDPLVNLVGWFFISIRKPFRMGDRIQIGELSGDVIDIRLFQFTVMEIGNWVDADQSTGRMIHVPNGLIFKQPQANYTEDFDFIWNELPIIVTFESDWSRAKDLLEEIARDHSAIPSEHVERAVQRAAHKYLTVFQHLTPIVWTSVADQGVTLTIRYLCHVRKRRSTAGAIWEEVLTKFAEEPSIDFAYPTTRFYDNKAEGKPGAGGPPD